MSSIFWYNILPVAIGVILFIAQYLYIYNINPVDSKDGIAVAPFLFLSNWINLKLLPFTVLASITFPLVLFISYFNTLKKELIVKYAVALFTVALLIGFTFIETGHRRWDGNFMWQAIVCSFILYLVACKQLLKIYLTKGVDLRIKFNTVVFLLHFIIGIVYLAFYFKTGVYL
ncbi:MAG: hypothetical protein HY738_03485 [Bacteroidia bacterium]|nr:hypothetical protein [Bacteroidia bacterium]